MSLAFPDHDAGARLAAEAGGRGLPAQVVAEDGWPAVLAGAELVHVHAGIGWEGHALTRAAAHAGAAVVRTEHLPWLLTDPAQIADYAAASAQVDALIAVSRDAAAGWRRAVADMPGPRLPVAGTPNGIDAAGPVPRHQPAAPTILCVGRFTPQKRHVTLLAALARLRRDGVETVLHLVGTGPQEAALRRHAGRLGICLLYTSPSPRD